MVQAVEEIGGEVGEEEGEEEEDMCPPGKMKQVIALSIAFYHVGYWLFFYSSRSAASSKNVVGLPLFVLGKIFP